MVPAFNEYLKRLQERRSDRLTSPIAPIDGMPLTQKECQYVEEADVPAKLFESVPCPRASAEGRRQRRRTSTSYPQKVGGTSRRFRSRGSRSNAADLLVV